MTRSGLEVIMTSGVINELSLPSLTCTMSSAGITSVSVRYQVLFKVLLSPDKPARPEEEPPEKDFFC